MWLASGFVCGYLIIAMIVSAAGQDTGKQRACVQGRVAIACTSTTSTLKSNP